MSKIKNHEKSVTIRMSRMLHANLSNLARSQNKTVSQLTRDILKEVSSKAIKEGIIPCAYKYKTKEQVDKWLATKSDTNLL